MGGDNGKGESREAIIVVGKRWSRHAMRPRNQAPGIRLYVRENSVELWKPRRTLPTPRSNRPSRVVNWRRPRASRPRTWRRQRHWSWRRNCSSTQTPSLQPPSHPQPDARRRRARRQRLSRHPGRTGHRRCEDMRGRRMSCRHTLRPSSPAFKPMCCALWSATACMALRSRLSRTCSTCPGSAVSSRRPDSDGPLDGGAGFSCL